MHDGNRVDSALPQAVANHLRIVRLTPWNLVALGLQATRLDDLGESLTERAVHERQRPAPDAVTGRGLHQAGGRRTGQEHQPFGSEDVLEPGLQLLHERSDAGSAVTDHGPPLRLEHFRPNFGGARQKEPPEARGIGRARQGSPRRLHLHVSLQRV